MIYDAALIGREFLSVRQPPPHSTPVPEEIGRRIEAEHEAARRQWNSVEVDMLAFARALGVRCKDPSQPFERSRVLAHAQDVYLAVACELRDDAALAAFDPVLVREVGKAAAKVREGAAFAEEVTQAVRVLLFLGGAGSRPRIGDYDGAGPLRSWLRVMAARQALNMVRGAGEQRRADDVSEVLAAIPAADDPELEYAKARHAREFREAIVEALRGLRDEQRTLLQFYHRDGRTVEEIGRILGVHHATIVRRLVAAREALVESVHGLLKERLRLDSKDLASLARFVRSRIGESILAMK